MAFTVDHRLYAWGNNSGDGTGDVRYAPREVASIPQGIAVAAGYGHSLAVRSTGSARLANGEVYAWGRGLQGQLGLGTSVDSTTPQQIPGLSARLIAAGAWHSLALRNDGVLVAWGYNASGQLGNGTTSSSTTPAAATS